MATVRPAGGTCTPAPIWPFPMGRRSSRPWIRHVLRWTGDDITDALIGCVPPQKSGIVLPATVPADAGGAAKAAVSIATAAARPLICGRMCRRALGKILTFAPFAAQRTTSLEAESQCPSGYPQATDHAVSHAACRTGDRRGRLNRSCDVLGPPSRRILNRTSACKRRSGAPGMGRFPNLKPPPRIDFVGHHRP